jgi:hypothetical protein
MESFGEYIGFLGYQVLSSEKQPGVRTVGEQSTLPPALSAKKQPEVPTVGEQTTLPPAPRAKPSARVTRDSEGGVQEHETSSKDSRTLIMSLLVALALVTACCAFVKYHPDNPMSQTMQTCALKAGILNGKGSGKEASNKMRRTNASNKPPPEQKKSQAERSTGKTLGGGAADMRTESEQGTGALDTLAYTAGAAITSTIGYGLFWFFTQG